MQKVVEALEALHDALYKSTTMTTTTTIMPATVFLRLRLRVLTNNTDIGQQDRIVLNIAKSDAY